MKQGLLTITFHHYWHPGSGMAGIGDVDLLPVTETCGLPFLPARSLRGRLKQAAREAGLSSEDLLLLFGIEDAPTPDLHGSLQLANALMAGPFATACRDYHSRAGHAAPEVAALFEDIASTAIDPKTGIAQDGSLRRIRYVIPVTLEAKVSVREESHWDMLEKCASSLRAIGKGKRDGYGWCEVILEATAGNYSPETEFPKATSLEIDLELLDDAVFSQTSATTGGHRTLDHAPGSALLGAVASVLFQNDALKTAEALARQQIRFTPAYPVEDAVRSLPLPLAWHHEKGQSWKDRETHYIFPGTLHNLAAILPGSRQMEQLREDLFLPAVGRVIALKPTYRLKTAVSTDPAQYETAKEGQLFGYQAMPAGTRLRGRVEFTGDHAAELAEATVKALHGQIIRLGRSRGTEYGRAKCQLSKAPAGQDPVLPAEARSVTLYAESDLALVDENGFPKLEPSAADFNLPGGWKLVPEKSFLRFRRYALWNAKRHGPDLERQVIAKGSVLVFQGDFPSPKPILTRVGIGWAEGLGCIQVNPDFLRGERPVFDTPSPQASEPVAAAPGYNESDFLTQFIQARYREKQLEVDAAGQARKWADKWRRTGSEILKRPSQWGRLHDAARRSTTVAELKAELTPIFKEGRMSAKWTAARNANAGSLSKAILDSLDTAGLNDRLKLAAFRQAVHTRAAEARRQKD